MTSDKFADVSAIRTFMTKGIQRCKVLVLGDVMLDRYFYGEVKRISPEAPVPIALIKEIKETLGGAANVCSNLAKLGCKVYLAGVTGNDITRTRVCQLLDEIGVNHAGLITDNDRPTISKTRIIGGHQQILRLDFEETLPLFKENQDEIKTYIDDILPQVESVIISDYAKGVCTPELCQYVIKSANASGVPVIVDPKGTNWQKYKGSFIVTPNLKELGEAVKNGSIRNEDSTVLRLAEKLIDRYQLTNLIVTRSEKGLSLVSDHEVLHIPTTAQEVFDVSGAGDTVIAVLGAALAGGIGLGDAARLANIAAGVVVGKLGTYAINSKELQDALKASGKLQSAAEA